MTESQIVCESFLEDLNSFLNSGEVPLLFSTDEVIELLGRPMLLAETERSLVWSLFVSTCKDNLTVVITLSPGSKFQQRIQHFTALVNCSVVDWFADWPEEGLLAVASACVRIFASVRQQASELL